MRGQSFFPQPRFDDCVAELEKVVGDFFAQYAAQFRGLFHVVQIDKGHRHDGRAPVDPDLDGCNQFVGDIGAQGLDARRPAVFQGPDGQRREHENEGEECFDHFSVSGLIVVLFLPDQLSTSVYLLR